MKKPIVDIGECLLGTCHSLDDYLDDLEYNNNLSIDKNELENELKKIGIERCPYCDWWYRTHELINSNGIFVGCDSCNGQV